MSRAAQTFSRFLQYWPIRRRTPAPPKDFQSRLQDVQYFAYGAFKILSWVPAVSFLHTHVVDFVWVRGPSMSPALSPDYKETGVQDVLLTHKWNPTAGLQRGHIIVFRVPDNPERIAVKRITAMEGDIVRTRAPYPYPSATVPHGHVWVEGDSPRESKDSNYYGPISTGLIIGKAWWIVYPFDRLGRVRWEKFNWRRRTLVGATKKPSSVEYEF